MGDAQFFGLEGGEQVGGDGFDAFEFGGGEVGFVEQVEDGEGFFVQAFAGGAGFFLAHGLHIFEQFFEGLLDGDTVFFAVVVGDDLVVVALEVCAQWVLFEQALQALFDGLPEILHGGVFGRRAFKLFAQAFEVDLADVVGWAVFGGLQRLGGDDFIHHLMQLAQDVADVGLFAVFLQGLVDDVERVT